MDMVIKQRFVQLWEKYFCGADLPMIFYYTDETGGAELVKPPSGHRCIFADLAKVRTGMFDVSARPSVSEDILTFSVPMNKFTAMVENMEESFLITRSWAKIQKRMEKAQ